MARLGLAISSSSPAVLAHQADKCERRERARIKNKKVKPGFPVNSGFTFSDRHRGLSLRVMVVGDAKDTAEWER